VSIDVDSETQFPSDIEIAEAARIEPVLELARDRLGIPNEALVPYGHDKAKITLRHIASLADRPDGVLVLVTAMSPTPAGEGKTSTSVGLADGLQRLGVKSMVALREPSMGPVFGVKGGAAGGGYAQVVPMTDINLAFTGDFAAIAAANNLLAALVDNHVHHGNQLGIDPRTITWKRVVDLNDRALRDIVVGLGGVTNGFPREDGFDIVVASEVMAILCLAESIPDLKARLGDIVVAHDRDKNPVTARDLRAEGAMTVLLRDALAPNLVQTLEHTPALVHGGPFANIAHGCNSLIATRTALKVADYVVTEAGFGADLGAEKFIDIKCRVSGLRPAVVVVVATVRALKFHGGIAVADLSSEDVPAVLAGLPNLRRHLETIRDVFGLPAVVAVNRFPSDTDAEVQAVIDHVAADGFAAHEATHVAQGGGGAEDLARGVMAAADANLASGSELRFAYGDDLTLVEKAEAVATRVYGASGVVLEARAARRLAQIEAEGHGRLPVCMAKTQMSFSTDPTQRGAPSDHVVTIREVRLSAGAGFVVMVTGDVMTMPGLPRVPATVRIDVDVEGRIIGLS